MTCCPSFSVLQFQFSLYLLTNCLNKNKIITFSFARSQSSLPGSEFEFAEDGGGGSELQFTCVLAYSMGNAGNPYEIMRAAGGWGDV